MEASILCAGMLGFFALLFGFILMLRFLSYRETMALAEKGLVRPMRGGNRNRAALVWGLIISAIGLALTLGLWPLGWSMMGPGSYPLGFGPWMLVGLVPLFFGLALIFIYILTRGDEKNVEPPAAEGYPLSDDLGK